MTAAKIKLTAEQKKMLGAALVAQIEQREGDFAARESTLTDIENLFKDADVLAAVTMYNAAMEKVNKAFKVLTDLGGSRADSETVAAYAAERGIELGGRGRGVTLDAVLQWVAAGRPTGKGE